MLFFVFLSLVAMFLTSFWVRVRRQRMSITSDGSEIASGASRLCRTHRRASIFVDFNHIASGVSTAREAFETFWALRDDRVGIGASLDHVALFDLLVKERLETIPARA